MADIDTLVKELGQLTVLEALELSKKLSKEWKKKLDDEKASVESIMREREDAKKLTKLTLPKLKKIKDGKKKN